MSQQNAVRTVLSLAAVACLACAALLAAPAPAAAEAPFVFIDAGHGGPYSNANENGLLEKDVNLLIALELRQRLASMGYRVAIDRTTDTALATHDIPTWHERSGTAQLYADGSVGGGTPTDDLQERVNLANRAGADLFVSIHCNGVTNKSVQGVETFGASGDALGRKLAGYVQAEIVSELGVVDRGAKTTDFYVLKWSNMPAMLLEAGFVSNPLEANRLKSPVYRWRVARAMSRAIARFFAEQPFANRYARLAGAGRYDTAVAASKAGWPSGAQTVLLASGTDFPDALAASPLSKKYDAPLLLTWPGALPEATKAELARLRPSTLIVLGGEAAVSATAAAEATRAVSAAGAQEPVVRRIGGADRYETAMLIANDIGIPYTGRVTIVSGSGFPDALSAAAYSAVNYIPILLSTDSGLPPASREFIEANRPAIKQVLVAGSTAAVPEAAVAGLPGVTRLEGPDRWTTNAAWLRQWGTDPIAPIVANGNDFPDGLVGAAYGVKVGQPVMLVAPRVLPDRGREFVEQNSSRIRGFTIVGASGAEGIPPLMDTLLGKAMY